jgi:hypothetical protein
MNRGASRQAFLLAHYHRIWRATLAFGIGVVLFGIGFVADRLGWHWLVVVVFVGVAVVVLYNGFLVLSMFYHTVRYWLE